MSKKKQKTTPQAKEKLPANENASTGRNLDPEKVELPPKWLLFTDEYMRNGFNGTQAYKSTYEVEQDNVASAAAARLLRNVNISEEIRRRLEDQRITDSSIIVEIWKIATSPLLRTERGAGAQVAALQALARIRGLLNKEGSKPGVFTPDNPPVIMVPFSDERRREIAELTKRERIIE